jgi:hypothetical protein
MNKSETTNFQEVTLKLPRGECVNTSTRCGGNRNRRQIHRPLSYFMQAPDLGVIITGRLPNNAQV